MQSRQLIFSSLFLILVLISACSVPPTITSSPGPSPSETTTTTPVTTPLPPRDVGSLGMGSAQDIAWTPDGQSLIVAGSQGLHFYNPKTWQLQKHIETPTELDYGYPESIYVSQDEARVLFVGTGGLWQTDLKDGQTIKVFRDAIYSDARALYSLDQKRIAFLRYTIAADGFASFYGLDILSTDNQEILATLIEESTTKIYAMKLSPDGHTLAAARADNLIYLFDINTGERIGTLAGHESDVLDIDFSPDGEHLASIGADATLRIWDIKTKQAIQTLHGFKKSMRAVAYTTNGTSLLGLIPDGQIERWSIDVQGQASAQNTIVRTDDLIQRMVIQPGGNLLALLGETNQIQVLDLNTGKIVQTFLEFGQGLDKLTWSKAGDQIATATDDWEHATIFVWNALTRELRHRYKLDTGSITDMAFSPDGKILAAVDRERFIRFWDLTATYDSLRIKSDSGDVGKLAFSPDGQYLAVASGTFQVWKLDKGEIDYHVVHEAQISGDPLCIAYSPDGKTIAVVTQQAVTTWDANSGKLLSSWQPDNHNFDNAQLFWEAGRGRVVLTLNWSGAFFYNLKDGTLLYSIQSTQNNFSPFALNFNKRLIVIGNSVPKIIDATSGNLLWSGMDQKQYWDKLALSPDGLALATSEYGNTIHLWDISGLSQAVARLPALTATIPPGPVQTITPTSTQSASLEMTALMPSTPQPGAIGSENLSQLIQFARLGKGGILSLAWAPDNRYFGLGTTLGIYVYAVQTDQEKGLVSVPGGAFQFALSPFGDKVLTSDLRVWDVNTGKQLYRLILPEKNPPITRYNLLKRLEFSRDGEWIYANFGDDICTWKVGQEQSTGCRLINIAGWDQMPMSVSPDGQWAIFLGDQNNAFLVNTQTQAVVHTFEYGENQISDVIFSPDGQAIAFVSYEEFKTYPGTITIGRGRIELWQMGADGTFTLYHALEIGKGKPSSFTSDNVFYTPDGKQLVLLNGNDEVQFWDVQSGRLLRAVANTGDQLALSPDGTWMLTADRQKQAKLWKIASGHQPQLMQSLDGFFSGATALAISSDGSLFSSNWNSIQRWDLSLPTTPRLVQQFENNRDPFSVSSDGSWLAAEAPNGMAQILETSSGKILASFQAAMFSESGSAPYINDLVLAPDKSILASVGSDWKIRLWNIQSGQMRQEIDLLGFMAVNLEISPDGRYLAASGNEYSDIDTVRHTDITTWDTSSGKMIRHFDLAGSEIGFHPNSVQLVSARGDGQIELLDLRSGKPAWIAHGLESISSLAFNPDGRLLATLNNKTIQFLDANTGKVLGELPVAFEPRSLAFSADGKILAVGCGDGTIRLFKIK